MTGYLGRLIKNEAGEIVEYRFTRFGGKLLRLAIEVSQPLQHQRDAGRPSLGLLVQLLKQPVVGDVSFFGNASHFIKRELQPVPPDLRHRALGGELHEGSWRLHATDCNDRTIRRHFRNGVSQDFMQKSVSRHLLVVVENQYQPLR